MLTSHSVVVDGTDIETWGRLQGSTVHVDLDGEAADTQLIEETSAVALTKRGKVKTARVLAIGPDGRKHVHGRSRRPGRSPLPPGQPKRAAPIRRLRAPFAVQTRDVRWTNHIDKTTLGPEVPNVITTCDLVPAGSHGANGDCAGAHRVEVRGA